MPFHSETSNLIWGKLYKVYIPDQLTLDREYIRRFGVHMTGNKEVDEMLKTNFTMVMIDIATILRYFMEGIEIRIPSREDMIQMHKDIEKYLEEWRTHVKTSIHGQVDAENHKDLLTALEKLSKHIYQKAQPKELLDNLFLRKENRIGIVNPIQQHQEENKPVEKPDYTGITRLIKRRPRGDSNGRF